MQILSCIILLFIPLAQAIAQVGEVKVAPWPGKNVQAGQGLLSLNLIPSKSLVRKGAGASVLKLYAAKNKKIYILEFDLSKDFKSGGRIWQLPLDSYKILQFICSTNKEILQYQGPHKKGLIVNSSVVTQTENWFVIERGNKNLALVARPAKVKSRQNTSALSTRPPAPPPLPTEAKKSSSLMNPPKKQKQVKGGSMTPPLLPSLKNTSPPPKKVSRNKPALRNPPVVSDSPSKVSRLPSKKTISKMKTGRKLEEQVSTATAKRQKMLPKINLKKDQTSRVYKDVRAIYTSEQTISMYYKIDLKRYNRYAAKMQKIIDRKNAKLRQCYSDSLEDKSNVRGNMHFKFLYSKTEKSFRTLKVINQTVNDPKFVECVYWELAAMSFPFKVDMIGDITFYYDLK